MTKEELEKLFLWSEKHGIAYTNGCLLSLNTEKLIDKKVFTDRVSQWISSEEKVFGVFTIDTQNSTLSLYNDEVLIHSPAGTPEWTSIRKRFLSDVSVSSSRGRTFLSKIFLGDVTDLRFSEEYREARELFISKYPEKKQIGDTIMYYTYSTNQGGMITVIQHIQNFENGHFVGPSIWIKKGLSGSWTTEYKEEGRVDKILSNYFCVVNRPETQATCLSLNELKELNSMPGRTSCAKCHGQLKLVEGFSNNYSYCPKCE